jgi:predicted enzyme related to lactoylglutathione lyase
MSKHTSWPHGTPSWTDNASQDPAAAAEFYSGLFGWQASDQMPPEEAGRYFMCTLGGKSVAACGSQPVEGMPPVWNTYVTVDDVDEVAGRVAAAGGAVMMEPFDVMGAGRMAVFTDPVIHHALPHHALNECHI